MAGCCSAVTRCPNQGIVYPKPIVKRYGSDALRYYLMREMPFNGR